MSSVHPADHESKTCFIDSGIKKNSLNKNLKVEMLLIKPHTRWLSRHIYMLNNEDICCFTGKYITMCFRENWVKHGTIHAICNVVVAVSLKS